MSFFTFNGFQNPLNNFLATMGLGIAGNYFEVEKQKHTKAPITNHYYTPSPAPAGSGFGSPMVILWVVLILIFVGFLFLMFGGRKGSDK